MSEKETEYVKTILINKKIVRGEILFAPILILLPIVVSGFLIWDWYARGWSRGSLLFDGELVLAVIILVGNLVFDIPFVKSLLVFNRK